MRGDRNERLTILSESEKTALYGIPNFDEIQRIKFFAMTDAESEIFAGLGLQPQSWVLNLDNLKKRISTSWTEVQLFGSH